MPMVQIGKALKPVRVDNLMGGYIPSKSLETLKDNEWQTLTNWDFTLDGDIETRAGLTSYSGVDSIVSLFRWRQSDGTLEWVGLTSGGGFYAHGTLIGSGFSSVGATAKFAVFQGKLYFVGGHVGSVYRWDGTTRDTATADIDSPRCLVAHKERLWVADAADSGAANPVNGVVYYSSVDDATTYDTTNGWFDIGSNDGGYIVGMFSTLGGLVILKTNGIWMIYGSDPDPSTGDMRKDQIYDDIGCVGVNACVQIGQAIYFMSTDGIYRLSNGALDDIGVDVWKGDFDPLLSVDDAGDSTRSTLALTKAAHIGREIWWLVSSDGTDLDRIYVYSLVNNTWRRREGLDYLAICGRADDLDNVTGFITTATDVFNFGGVGDNGSSISTVAKTKPFDHGEPDLVKQYPGIGVRATIPASGTLTVTWDCDRGTRTGTKTITATGYHRLRLPATAWGQDISLKFTTDDTHGTYKVQAYQIDAMPKRWATVG